MNMWSSLLSGGAQEQVVKRACGRSFILEGAVHHVEGCSCRAVSVIEELHSESPGFFQANNPQSIAGELFAAGNIADVSGDRTLQCCEVSARAGDRRH